MHIKANSSTNPLIVQGVQQYSYVSIPNNSTKYRQLIIDTTTGIVQRGLFSAGVAQAAGFFYDDTTGISVTGGSQPTTGGPYAGMVVATTSPNGTAYSGVSSYGVPVGAHIPVVYGFNIDSIKKVAIGTYKVFMHPGTVPNNTYSLALTCTDGLQVANDDDWQVANAPYTTGTGNTLGNAAARENETLINNTTTYNFFNNSSTSTNQHYITRQTNYFYITTTYGGAYDAAYVSFEVFY